MLLLVACCQTLDVEAWYDTYLPTYLLLPTYDTYFGLTQSQRRFSIFLILCGMEDYILIPTRAANWRELYPWFIFGDLG